MKHGFLISCAFAALLAYAPGAFAQKLDRGLSISSMPTFVAKGSWMVGGSANWTFHENENFRFLVADGVNSSGYKVNVSPAVCYMVKDNMGVGLRMGYSRSNLKIDEAGVGVGDIGLDMENYHTLKHTFQVQGIMRNYIPVGNAKKIALFNEVQLGYRFGTRKVVNGAEEKFDGSYGNIRNLALNLCPGIVAFANDHLAVDVNVNMLGLSFGNTDQSHNQVAGASFNSTVMNFQVNILAIGFGLYYYL
ncbi:MAG: hypothetical protein HUJ94_05145 [Bacteroidales bacterium]|nr:hypothetical protein [Bacteroidales bacterium]